jgi:hypothetical protein
VTYTNPRRKSTNGGIRKLGPIMKEVTAVELEGKFRVMISHPRFARDEARIVWKRS